MSDDRASFSLITEPWIRCQLMDGGEQLLSIAEVFDGSIAVLGLRGDSPTQDYAVLRILLAIFWRAHRRDVEVAPGETFEFFDWREEAWLDVQGPGADEGVLDYLEVYSDRFDLLHLDHPFMQVRGLQTANGGSAPVTRIVPEAEQEYFSMRGGSGLDTLDLAEAARWLIHCQAYDYSGIKSGALGDDRVKGGKGYPIGVGWTGNTGGTTIIGRSLRETLVLNTSPSALTAGELDRPVWEREPDGPSQRELVEPTGPSDLATWQSRRIRLDVEGGKVVSVLVSNGDQIPRAGANVLNDPMTPYRYSSNKSSKTEDVHYAREFDTDRMMWRSLEPLLALDGDVELPKKEKPGFRPATLVALGNAREGLLAEAQHHVSIRLTSASYGAQQSSASTTVDARIEIPRHLLDESASLVRRAVLDTARSTLGAAISLGSFGGRLLQAAGGEYAFRALHTDALLADLEPDFRRWLGRLDPERDLEPALVAWQRAVRDATLDQAKVLLRGAGPKALIGREVTQNDRTRLETAGTAYSQLQRDLAKHLPLLTEPATPTKETADV